MRSLNAGLAPARDLLFRCGLWSLEALCRGRANLIMLILTRKKDEKIMIGHDVEVMVQRINAQSIRLGIAAPKRQRIKRMEILQPHGKSTSRGQQQSRRDTVQQ